MASPELWQRVYAIKDKKHFRRSIIMSSLFYIIVVGFILLLIGLVIRADIPDISADTSLIVGFSSLLPVGLAGLSVVIIYSSVSSSADTYMFTASASVTQDFLEKTGLTKPENLRRPPCAMAMLLLMILGVTMALLLRDIVDSTFFFRFTYHVAGFIGPGPVDLPENKPVERMACHPDVPRGGDRPRHVHRDFRKAGHMGFRSLPGRSSGGHHHKCLQEGQQRIRGPERSFTGQ
jgi:hypothetical protein